MAGYDSMTRAGCGHAGVSLEHIEFERVFLAAHFELPEPSR
jgi:hypothetical protein